MLWSVVSHHTLSSISNARESLSNCLLTSFFSVPCVYWRVIKLRSTTTTSRYFLTSPSALLRVGRYWAKLWNKNRSGTLDEVGLRSVSFKLLRKIYVEIGKSFHSGKALRWSLRHGKCRYGGSLTYPEGIRISTSTGSRFHDVILTLGVVVPESGARQG